MKKPYIIAEMGVNFYDTAKSLGITPMEAAKLYIKKAKEVGVDAAKFQSYKADTIASKNSPSYWDLSKNPITSQYQLFKGLDSFNKNDYEELFKFCKKIGIDFMSTPFDYNSTDYLNDYVDVYKISSSDITNFPFIRYIARKKKPIYLSVGASYLSEVDEAIRIIRDEGNNSICLFHCVLSYPTKNEDANLNIIQTLKRIYPDISIGYSDHTHPDDNMTILTTAYLLGAEIIEKHFTLDKTLKGNDHFHAGDPDDFKKAIENFKLINKILGSKEKDVLQCEQIPRREARRSLVLTHDMQRGDILSEKDFIAKRPGTGISPKYQDLILGRPLKEDLKEDSILKWEYI